MLDLHAPDSDIAATGPERWATLCTSHQTLTFHTSVSTAEALASHPEEWCPPCEDATRARATERVYGPRAAGRKPA